MRALVQEWKGYPIDLADHCYESLYERGPRALRGLGALTTQIIAPMAEGAVLGAALYAISGNVGVACLCGGAAVGARHAQFMSRLEDRWNGY